MFECVIEHLNQERNVVFTNVSETAYEGFVKVYDDEFKLCIELGKGFPSDFPEIKIIEGLKFLPHVSPDGIICLFNKESIMIKPDMPKELLLESFDRAVAILGADDSQKTDEIFREFFLYWTNKSDLALRIFVNLKDAEEHEYKEYYVIGSNEKCLIVSNSLEESKALLINNLRCNPKEVERYKIRCVRIKLRSSKLPPLMESKITWKSIREYILKNISGSQKRRFNRFLKLEGKIIKRLIILTIPSKYGDQNACFLIQHKSQKRKCSIRNSPNCKLTAIVTSRIDQRYMLTRGGADMSIIKKEILLIGCGSVGGFLAESLCQCGIGSLDILDKEVLTVDNVHRHVLGFDDAMKGEYKSDLIKEHLEKRFPYVDIDSLCFKDRTAETFLKCPDRMKNYDLIVSATGDPTINLAINDALHKLDDAPPFIVCFNEPYGIGGHAIAIVKNSACLKCLYSDPISGELVPFQASFVKPGQSFLKTLSGCSSSFVEYSVLDSQQTAIFTTRLIIDTLNGNCSQTRLCSWVGTAEKLRNAGFMTSEYYDELEGENHFFDFKYINKSKRCRTCGKLS